MSSPAAPDRRTTTGRAAAAWPCLVPPAALVVLVATWRHHEGAALLTVIAVALVGAVLASVQHAEVVAHRVGEPYGSLVLAVAVTVIEVGLVVMLLRSGSSTTYARDTVFAAVMITTNGIVGVALLIGALRHHTVRFNAEGTGSLLATVVTLAALTLVLPGFTVSARGLAYSGAQLVFASVASLLLYGAFVLSQAGRYRDFFLPVGVGDDEHAAPPPARAALISLGLLLVALVSVVGLAKLLSPAVESGIAAAGLPVGAVGVLIAVVVLAPESIAAVRNARRDRVQISLNLAYGSAMASIGLTIPAIAVASIWLTEPLLLGLEPLQITLLAITVGVSVLTVAQGRATTLQGTVHLALMATYVFFSLVP